MTKQELSLLSDDELLLKKKELQKSKIVHAILIGFLAGVIAFGLGGWLMSEERNIGFFIPMLFPIYFIYRLLKGNDEHKVLEEVLSERGMH